jgi:hypothetical protein
MRTKSQTQHRNRSHDQSQGPYGNIRSSEMTRCQPPLSGAPRISLAVSTRSKLDESSCRSWREIRGGTLTLMAYRLEPRKV